jgi:hypothetical protein
MDFIAEAANGKSYKTHKYANTTLIDLQLTTLVAESYESEELKPPRIRCI